MRSPTLNRPFLTRQALRLLGVLALTFGAFAMAVPSPASAAPGNPWPHRIVNGFSTPDGDGFWLVYGDGTVEAHGTATFFGDASSLPLNGPVIGGSVTPDGNGYWLVAFDGGIFTFGNARFFGSMGGVPLNSPVFSMTPTESGNGYWLVAFDGGIFTFGDAKFFGSTGNLVLNEPIVGISTSPSGKGYRMVARDGGIFSFGDVPFFGSLPGLPLGVDDVVGMAPTPSNDGYWIAREGGEIDHFGDAIDSFFFDGQAQGCDPVAAIFSNPNAPGIRLVLESGATLPFGDAPGGDSTTGGPFCLDLGFQSPFVGSFTPVDPDQPWVLIEIHRDFGPHPPGGSIYTVEFGEAGEVWGCAPGDFAFGVGSVFVPDFVAVFGVPMSLYCTDAKTHSAPTPGVMAFEYHPDEEVLTNVFVVG